MPDRVADDSQNHANHDGREGEALLVQAKIMICAEDQGKGAEEKVEDAEEDGGVKTESLDHQFLGEELHRAVEREADSFD